MVKNWGNTEYMPQEETLIINPEFYINNQLINQNKTKFIIPIAASIILGTAILLNTGDGISFHKNGDNMDMVYTQPNLGYNNFCFIEYNAINTQSGLEVFSMEKMMGLNMINQFRNLEFNWNGNGAEPFSEQLLQKSITVLNCLDHTPEIYPTASKSIQFEYEKENGEYLEFEIFDSYIHVFKVDKEENEIEFVENDLFKINQMVVDFYG